MPTQLPTVETVDPAATLEAAWDAIGREPSYPCDTETCLAILGELGLDLSQEKIDYLARTLQFAANPAGWVPESIIALAAMAHTKRWWLPYSDLWRLHATGPARALQEGRETGRLAQARGPISQWQIRDLALMILQAPNRELAEQSFSLLEAKLTVEGRMES